MRTQLPALQIATACLAILFASATLFPAAAGESGRASLSVDTTRPGHRIPNTLWGIFFEDINLSADGGIYPEFVRNRSFEDNEQPESWKLVKPEGSETEVSTDTSRPLNPFNRRSLRWKLDGQGASLVNEGYWGMNVVEGEQYLVKLAARAAEGFEGKLAVALETREGRELAGGTINGISNAWKYFELRLNAREAGDPKAQLRLSASGKGTVWLDMVSVLPARTWKGHGLRPDLCEMLVGLQPAFNRFPGGCWVEGDDLAHMYQWKRTIGDIDQRTPLYNIWGYHATHGLGYHEYLQMSEDLGAEPLFCINVGMSHREVVPMEQMGQWVQDALDALEYANGPTNSVWGALRAKNGHPEPFNLKYVEIGNENGGPAYNERWPLFVKAIREKYPEVKLIANHWGGRPSEPAPEIVDEHYYDTPEFFMRHATHYDKYDRNGPKIFVGEYAVTRDCGLGNLRGAVGEAAFMTGLERNSDVVMMASYAPLFVNLNHRRWNPDLINFDSSRVYGLPSYYVQQMFSKNRGDVLLPVKVEAPETSVVVQGGAIGVGTWRTRAEFKDLKVTRDGQTLFEAEFANGLDGWKRVGGGEWAVVDGALRQSSLRENVRAVAGSKDWHDYTYTLKARKISGDEGFLILFNVQNEEQKSWWNLGGWNNTSHAIESGGVGSEHVNGSIETGRWYDIRIETRGGHVKCYLDGKLVHDVAPGTIKSLYATAATDEDTGELIIKAVNASADPLVTQVSLKGVSSVGSAKATVLTSEKGTDENTIDEPRKVSPRTHELQITGPDFTHEFPGNSVTVLRIKP